jgi:hypothetical protein
VVKRKMAKRNFLVEFLDFSKKKPPEVIFPEDNLTENSSYNTRCSGFLPAFKLFEFESTMNAFF